MLPKFKVNINKDVAEKTLATCLRNSLTHTISILQCALVTW